MLRCVQGPRRDLTEVRGAHYVNDMPDPVAQAAMSSAFPVTGTWLRRDFTPTETTSRWVTNLTFVAYLGETGWRTRSSTTTAG